MKSKFRPLSVISAVLALISAVVFLSPSAAALTYNGSASYESGPYYKKLCSVNLTGNARTDIVNIAKSQIGYFEGNSSSELSGTVNGKGNYTEYGRWYGLQDMWCAMFVSWCAYVAGVPESVVPKHAYTPSGLQWFQNKGQAYSRANVAAGKYTPQPGDIIYFKSSRNSNPTNHVGIVTKYSNGTVYTVEGNTSSATISTNGGIVADKSYSIDNTYIVYICKPNYGSAPENTNFQATLDESSTVPGGIRIRGWCFDKRDTSLPLEVHVYFGGPAGASGAEGNSLTVANASRPDVDNVFHCGANHGFESVVETSKTGKIPVYIYAVNPNNHENKLISSFTAEIKAKEQAPVEHLAKCLDVCEAVPGGISISGWCFDKNDQSRTLQVHVYFGGPSGSADAEGDPSTVADAPRPDVDNVYHCGTAHGFSNVVYTSLSGKMPVYIYAVNPANGDGELIATREVTIPAPHDPEGVVDNVKARKGVISLDGWTFDRDDLSQSLTVHIYVGDPAAAQPEMHPITADALREDVHKAYNCGKNHGFDAEFATDKTGTVEIFVYAINIYGGKNVLIGRTLVTIPDKENEQTEILRGDVNGDNAVDNKDVVLLFRYLSSVVKGEILVTYDFDTDGKVTNKDITSLFRYVNKAL